MNEHIHIDGDAVIIYGHRLTLDEARAAAAALRESIAHVDLLARQAVEKERDAKIRAELLALGWEESDDPAVLVRLVPGYKLDMTYLGLATSPATVRHRPVQVEVLLDAVAHIATGAPYCECGAYVHGATVLPDDHGLPMCRAHRVRS